MIEEDAVTAPSSRDRKGHGIASELRIGRDVKLPKER
jgi:hypothetical protein